MSARDVMEMREAGRAAEKKRSALCVAACAGVPDAALVPEVLAWHREDAERLAAALRPCQSACRCSACEPIRVALAEHDAGPTAELERMPPGALEWHIQDGKRLAAALAELLRVRAGRKIREQVDAALAEHDAGPTAELERMPPGALEWHIQDGKRLAAALAELLRVRAGRKIREQVDAALAEHDAGPGQGQATGAANG